jgi:hypothetical protein
MNKKTVVLVVGCGLLALLWLQAEIRYRLFLRNIQSLQVCEVTLRAVDDENNKPVPMSLEMRGRGPDTPLPAWRTEATGATNSQRVIWAGIEPLLVKVSSEGYEEQVFHLNEHGEATVTVRLRRQKPT